MFYLPEDLQRMFSDRLLDEKIANVRMQMDFYFGDCNYPNDSHLHRILNEEGYAPIESILTWNRMRHWRATHDDVLEAARYSNIFEISPNQMGARKKAQDMN